MIDLKGENRYVFVLPLGEKLVLINGLLPRVFVVPTKGLRDFFEALAEGRIEEISGKGVRGKGRKWRFLIDIVASVILISLEDYLHLGLWSALILGAVVASVEYLFGPRNIKTRTFISELNEKTVRKVYKASEKKGLVEVKNL